MPDLTTYLFSFSRRCQLHAQHDLILSHSTLLSTTALKMQSSRETVDSLPSATSATTGTGKQATGELPPRCPPSRRGKTASTSDFSRRRASKLEVGAVPQTGAGKHRVEGATGKWEAPNPFVVLELRTQARPPSLREPVCVPAESPKAEADLSTSPEG